MMKHTAIFLSVLLLAQPLVVQAAGGDGVKAYHARNMRKHGVPSGGYSGIAYLGGDSFAIVSDCHTTDAVRILHLDINPRSGKLRHVSLSSSQPVLTAGGGALAKVPDYEDVAFVSQTATFFLVSEASGSVSEYALTGKATGKSLLLENLFPKGCFQSGYGIESLAYDERNKVFWLTSEASLTTDAQLPYGTLRLWSVPDGTAQPRLFRYQMDSLRWTEGAWHIHGVSALLATGDGRLLVMEREVSVPKGYVGAKTHTSIYEVVPGEGQTPTDFASSQPLPKRLLWAFDTRLKVGRLNFANSEGMCFGPRLNDGRQTLILVSDSQNAKGNAFYRLKDYLKVVVLP